MPFASAVSRTLLFAVSVTTSFLVTWGGYTAFRAIRGPSPASSSAHDMPGEPTPVPVTALTISATCSAEAQMHYREGLRALRDSSWELAYPAFEKAVAADPICPEPRVQLVIAAFPLSYSLIETREYFRAASAMRDALRERDRVVLDALAPLVTSEPADPVEAKRRLDAAVERFPLDAQILTLAGYTQMYAALGAVALEHILELGRRANRIDPDDADGWQVQAHALIALGRFDESQAAIGQCLARVPSSTDCIDDHIRILRYRGECAAAVAVSRRWIANVPTSAKAHLSLANALASTGASPESVDTALQLVGNSREPGSDGARRYHHALLAAARGDFVNAERMGRELATFLVPSASLFHQARSAAFLVELLLEIGKREQALAVAEQFTKQRDAWVMGVQSASVYEPLLLSALHQHDRPSRDRWRSASELWEARALATLGAHDAWALRWGPVSQTHEVALDAWGIRPTASAGKASLQTPVLLHGLAKAFEGRIALEAGEFREAAAILEASTQRCDTLEDPFGTVRAHLWLGAARELSGDTARACEAYRLVLQRWGNTKPRSITADEARARVRTLGCSVTP